MSRKFEPRSKCLKSTILTRILDIGMTAAAFFPTLSFTRHISEINRAQAFTYTSGCFTPFYRVLALQVSSSSSLSAWCLFVTSHVPLYQDPPCIWSRINSSMRWYHERDGQTAPPKPTMFHHQIGWEIWIVINAAHKFFFLQNYLYLELVLEHGSIFSECSKLEPRFGGTYGLKLHGWNVLYLEINFCKQASRIWWKT